MSNFSIASFFLFVKYFTPVHATYKRGNPQTLNIRNISTMDIFCAFLIYLTIAGITVTKSKITNGEEADILKMCTNLQKRVLALERAQDEREIDISSGLLMSNDTNLEERVQALEFQMENVHEDMTVIEGEISVINSEQDLQDTQLQIIEEDVQTVTAVTDDLQTSVVSLEEDVQKIEVDIEGITGTINELTSVTNDLQSSVVSLQETDAGLVEDIAQLTEVDTSLDSRLFQLEVDGAVAFHASIGTYISIPEDSVVIFNNVNVNLGEGYDRGTGQFTVPSGDAGIYYFYAHFSLEGGTQAWMNVRHNGVTVSMMNEDGTQTGEYPAGSCGAVIQLQEGKVTFVRHNKYRSNM